MKTQKDFFQKRDESEIILEYTFMLPSTKGNEKLQTMSRSVLDSSASNTTNNAIKMGRTCVMNKLNDWVEECFMFTHTNCNSFLPHYVSDETFFHQTPTYLRQDLHGFSILEGSHRFWYFILRQNAIMSAYDKLRRFISISNQLEKGAHFLNFLMPFGIGEEPKKNYQRYGLYNLLISDAPVTLSDSGKIKISVPKKGTADMKSYFRSRNSRLLENAEKLESNLLQSFNPQILNTINIKNPLLQLNTLELYQYLIGRKKDNSNGNVNLNTIFKIHREQSISDNEMLEKYFNEYKTLTDKLQISYIDTNVHIDKIPGENLELVDRLYCRYLIEKETGIELTNCLYQNILSHPKGDYLRGITDFLSSVFKLPNTFSRNLILQTALDNLLYKGPLTSSMEETPYNEDEDLNFCDGNLDSILEFESIFDFDDSDFITLDKKDASIRTLTIEDINKNISELEQQINFQNPSELKLKFDNRAIDKIGEGDRAKLYNSLRNNLFKKNSRNITYSETTRMQIEQRVWEEKFVHCIDKLYKFIFPVFDNYFFNVLWNSMLPHCQSKKRNDIEANQLCAVRLFALLSRYLNHSPVINSLFNPEAIFETPVFNVLSSYDSSMLIRPFPTVKKDADQPNIKDVIVDVDLYSKCVKSCKLGLKTSNAPDFLELEYIAPNDIGWKTVTDTLIESICFHN